VVRSRPAACRNERQRRLELVRTAHHHEIDEVHDTACTSIMTSMPGRGGLGNSPSSAFSMPAEFEKPPPSAQADS